MRTVAILVFVLFLTINKEVCNCLLRNQYNYDLLVMLSIRILSAAECKTITNSYICTCILVIIYQLIRSIFSVNPCRYTNNKKGINTNQLPLSLTSECWKLQWVIKFIIQLVQVIVWSAAAADFDKICRESRELTMLWLH